MIVCVYVYVCVCGGGVERGCVPGPDGGVAGRGGGQALVSVALH